MTDTFYADGTVKFNRLDAQGNPTGLVLVPGSQSIAIKPNNKLLTDQSKDRGMRGMVSAMISQRDPDDFTWTVKGFDKNKMAMMLMGNATPISQGGGTVTAEPVTAALGVLVPLANQNITAGSVVVTDSTAATTYIENVDYTVDYTGYIQANVGGRITAQQAIHVTYAYGARTGWRVAGSKVTQITGAFIFDGVNLSDGAAFNLTIPKVSFSSDKAFDLLDDKLSEFSFKGMPILVPGEESTHYFTYYD